MQPSFVAGKIKKSQLEDESAYFQFLRKETTTEFYSYEFPPPEASMWINYPTKDNLNRDYKYGGIEFNKS